MNLKTYLLLLCTAVFSQSIIASETNVNKEDFQAGLVSVDEMEVSSASHVKALSKKEARKQNKAIKKQKRFEKRMAWLNKFISKKMEKKAKKKGVDFQDDTEKWLWFAIFGWGAAIILSIIISAAFTTFWTLGWLIPLVSLAAFVCFVIWLVKKFG
jgi:hypothetical protein